MSQPDAGTKSTTSLRDYSADKRLVAGAIPVQQYVDRGETRKRRSPRQWMTRRFGPSRLTRILVLQREDGHCACCGAQAEYGDHTIQRRRGHDSWSGTEIQNLILLCGSPASSGCARRYAEADPDLQQRGFRVLPPGDPAVVPVRLWTGQTVLLDDRGRYTSGDEQLMPRAAGRPA